MIAFIGRVPMKFSVNCLLATGTILFLLPPEAAVAIVVNVSSTGHGPVTYFDGLVQESTITFGGCPGSSAFCGLPANLTLDVPQAVNTHTATYDVGMYNSTGPSPDEMVTIETVFSAGGQSVSIFQSARFRQIGNGQFQFNVGASDTQTLILEPHLLLQITGRAGSGQMPAGFDGGMMLASNLLLTIPEPSIMVLVTLFGLATVLRRR